jgi:hypothetical protein
MFYEIRDAFWGDWSYQDLPLVSVDASVPPDAVFATASLRIS